MSFERRLVVFVFVFVEAKVKLYTLLYTLYSIK